MEKALYAWFLAQRKLNVPLSADILRKKASQLHAKYEDSSTSFNASDGWFKNFKKRHGIRYLKICGEKLTNKPHLVDPFVEELKDYIQKHGLTNDQIYNADESGLYYRLLPDHTLVSSNAPSAPGRKICKERVTFMPCSNVTCLHKLKLLVIGKSKNPRSLKGFANNPVMYKATKNAWMTSMIFKEWFHTKFVPEVKEFLDSKGLPNKALLLVDNAECHPTSELRSDNGLIVGMSLPPNCTALIQPMDQNIINMTKLNYKKSILIHLIDEKGLDLEKKIKAFNLKTAIQILAESWLKISPSSIKKSWDPLLTTSVWTAEDDMHLNFLHNQIREENEIMSSLFMLFEQIFPENNTSEEDVNQWINESYLHNTENETLTISDEEADKDHSDNENLETPKIKIDLAISSFNTCIEWARENIIPMHQTNTLCELRDCAFKKN